MNQQQLGILIWLVLVGPSRHEVIPNRNFVTISGPGVLELLFRASSSIPKYRSTGPDPDEGPYCFFNSSTNRMTTSVYVTSGFITTDSECGSNCELAGCTEYRLNSVTSGTYTQLSRCVVAEAFHYSLPGSRRELWCPAYDWNSSVFTYKGRVYKDQWYWLGWGSAADCINAVLCGPTSHYFDTTQSSTLAWCQPVPDGMYSGTCSNGVRSCNIPAFADDMRLAFWTSHGFGDPNGCGVRLIAGGLISAVDTSALNGNQWSISVPIQLHSPFVVGNDLIIIGTFLLFYIALAIVGPAHVILRVFHAQWTLTPTTAVILSDVVDWYPEESKLVIISLDRGVVSFFVNSARVGSVKASASTAYMPAVLTPQFTSLLTSSTMHVGPVFVNDGDFTSSDHPYHSTNDGIDATVGTVEIASSAFLPTTTTLAPTYTLASTISPSGSSVPSSVSDDRSASTTSDTQSSTTVYVERSSMSLIVTSATLETTETVGVKNVPVTGSQDHGLMVAFIVLVLVIAAVSVGFCLYRHRKKKRRRQSDAANSWIADLSMDASQVWDLPGAQASHAMMNDSINSTPTMIFRD